MPANGPVGYSEAKAALTAFSKRLSEEFGPRGVRVNTVSPGVVGIGVWRDLPEQVGMASRRITEPEEVGALITFLVSETVGNIVGADVIIDGGTIKTR